MGLALHFLGAKGGEDSSPSQKYFLQGHKNGVDLRIIQLRPFS
jgi:hypothetical protein